MKRIAPWIGVKGWTLAARLPESRCGNPEPSSSPLAGEARWGGGPQAKLFGSRLLHTLLFLLIGLSAAHAENVVALKAATEIVGATVRLSDVFDGVPAAIDREIATAPLPGKSVSYNARILTALAEQYRLDWQAQSVMDTATITRAATRITKDMIRDAVAAKLKEQNLSGTLDIAFDGNRLELALPASSAPDFTLNNFTYDQSSRRFRAELVASSGAPPLPVMGRVGVKRDMPVFARRLESGAVVGEGDIVWASMPVEHIGPDMVAEARNIVGRELRHAATEGQPVRARDVIPPRLVMRGATVVMKIETPFMAMTTQGRALQDGARGDVIRVINTRSNRTVEGVVEASGVVRIETAAKTASAG